MFPEFDPEKFPAPITRASAVQVDMEDSDILDGLGPDDRDEAIAKRTWFTWTATIAVRGNWVVDGFDLDHERLMEMLREDLGYAYEHELHVQVTTAPPNAMIRAVQGSREPEAIAADEQLIKRAELECKTYSPARDEGACVARNAAEFFANRSLPVTVDVLVELYDPLGIYGDLAQPDGHKSALVIERAFVDGFDLFYADGTSITSWMDYHRAWHHGFHGLARLKETMR